MAEAAESSGSSELEAMMEELGLEEDDLQDVIVEEDELPEEATRWMAIARIHTDKPYNQYWFFRNMRVAWDLAQEVNIKPLEENLYTMQFSCLGDWERVMEDGPWNFKGKAVMMAHYDGFTKPSSIELNKVEMWVQIHDFLQGYFSKIRTLSSTVGEFIYAEPMAQDFEGNFARVRVNIDVTKPLKNIVSLVVKKKGEVQRVLFRVKYERLPDWCAVCGYLGHTFKECGDGIHLPKALVFKDLRATWFRGPGRGPRESSGNRSGRGRGRAGRGRGRGGMQQNSHTPRKEDETEKNAVDVEMTEVERNRKRGASPVVDPKNSPNPPIHNGKGDMPLLLSAPEIPPSPSSKQEPKRNKATATSQDKGPVKNLAPSKPIDAHLAGPHGGSRQVQ
nr:uncharacterized protein LOC109755689 [Aegilops tauschii subsp. strangulata]